MDSPTLLTREGKFTFLDNEGNVFAGDGTFIVQQPPTEERIYGSYESSFRDWKRPVFYKMKVRIEANEQKPSGIMYTLRVPQKKIEGIEVSVDVKTTRTYRVEKTVGGLSDLSDLLDDIVNEYGIEVPTSISVSSALHNRKDICVTITWSTEE